MQITTITDLFHQEFGSIANKFQVTDVALSEAKQSVEPYISNPGVYVFWRPGAAIKVGRHLTNARKRALEHIRDNTAGLMAALVHDDSARLMLFSVKNPEDVHWVASLEIFFERRLGCQIRAARLG